MNYHSKETWLRMNRLITEILICLINKIDTRNEDEKKLVEFYVQRYENIIKGVYDEQQTNTDSINNHSSNSDNNSDDGPKNQ